AQHADQYAIIRSMSHGDSSHGSAGHAMLTGRLPKALGEVGPTADDFPHYGSVLARLKPRPHAIAPFVALPWAVFTSTNVVAGEPAVFLVRALAPFRREVADKKTPHFAPPLTALPPDMTFALLHGRGKFFDDLGSLTPLRGNATAGDVDGLYQ